MVKILVWRKIDESVRKKCKKIDSSWILGYGRGNDGMDGGVGGSGGYLGIGITYQFDASFIGQLDQRTPTGY